jgi:hypothetical protein
MLIKILPLLPVFVKNRGKYEYLLLGANIFEAKLVQGVRSQESGVRREEYISRLGLNRSLKLSSYFCRTVLEKQIKKIEMDTKKTLDVERRYGASIVFHNHQLTTDNC